MIVSHRCMVAGVGGCSVDELWVRPTPPVPPNMVTVGFKIPRWCWPKCWTWGFSNSISQNNGGLFKLFATWLYSLGCGVVPLHHNWCRFEAESPKCEKMISRLQEPSVRDHAKYFLLFKLMMFSTSFLACYDWRCLEYFVCWERWITTRSESLLP